MKPAPNPTPNPTPPPWAHLPAAEQEAIELALAQAFVAWLDDESAALERRTPMPHTRDAGGQIAGVSTASL